MRSFLRFLAPGSSAIARMPDPQNRSAFAPGGVPPPWLFAQNDEDVFLLNRDKREPEAEVAAPVARKDVKPVRHTAAVSGVETTAPA